MHWVPDGDGRRCPRHGKRFALGEPCPDCVLALKPVTAALEAEIADADDEYESEIREFAKGCRLSAVELLKLAEPNPAAKWGDLYLKSMRFVDDLRQRRLQAEQDEREMEHEREISGLAGLRGGH